MDIIEKHVFESGQTGKNVLFLGAVHGNETCGPKAIERVMTVLKENPDILEKGTVTFMPVCNPMAYQEGKRYMDVNLNRVIDRHPSFSQYEEGLADQIAQAIETADIVVDIHSATSPTTPFIVQMQQGQIMDDFAQALGIPCILSGDNIVPDGLSTTLHYTAQCKGQGLLVECGSHHEDGSTSVAEKVIWNTLAHADMIECEEERVDPKVFSLNGFVTYEKRGTLTRDFKGFEPVAKGEVLGTYDDGENITAPRDCYLVLPTQNPPIGEQWFFFADKKE